MSRKKVSHSAPQPGKSTHPPLRQDNPRSGARPSPLQWKEVVPSQPPLGLAVINNELSESPRSVARQDGTPPQEPCHPLPGWSTASVRACRSAKCRWKACVQPDDLPPTSRARSTSLAWPKCPVSSGYVLSFLRPAVARTVPYPRTIRERGRSSQRTAGTNLVLIAS